MVGRWLGLGVVVCFLTGLVSHLLQTPPGWLVPHLPTRPVWGYRVTQGLHVAAGMALVPLLLAKLWTVYPRLWVWPPVHSVRHALERMSIAVLVSVALLEVLMGLMNVVQWYGWPFGFRDVHWALGWVLVGALLLHVTVKAPVIVANWRRPRPAAPEAEADTERAEHGEDAEERDRRAFLLGVGAAVGVVTVVTVGQSVTPLAPATLLAPRHPDHGGQGVPVNRTAAQAGIDRAALADWRLQVSGTRGSFALSLAELGALPQHEAELPIACVEGWSVSARWSGVRLRVLLERAGIADGGSVRVVSLQERGAWRVMEMGPTYIRDPLTLLALRLNGATLSLDHGFPARIIAPNRPGVRQTKWVHRIEVL
ncbi:molybdopterin-dependent oxidoreductase [Streptomyces sp. YIM 98790]|uniref:molybdopterin-dependent oxidoreductase n=1 Tax=Streptomyces sp. YIM 98790 TaxID=2689077 RepID=UPI00140B7DEC|nr:molybdopterin-dependent oxidoreductase [Streptomyces sp. YIM 98790]